MPRDWYITQNGKTVGPIRSAKLKELAASGRLTADAKVANSPDGPWHPASGVKGLGLVKSRSNSQPSPAPQAPTPQPSPPQPQAPQPPAQATAVVAPSPNPAQQPAPATATESPVWTGRPSQITNIKTFILCGLFFWLVIPIFVAFWRWLVLRCMSYELTTQRYKVSHGVISRHTDELELYRVKDTTYSQNVFQRIFGLATVHMKTSDPSTPFVSIHSIGASQAKSLREQIRSLTEELRDRKRVREVDYV